MASPDPIRGAVHLYRRWDRAVRGWPQPILTAALVIVGVFSLWLAFTDKAGLKGIVVAWMVLP